MPGDFAGKIVKYWQTIGTINWYAFILSAVCLVIIFVWPKVTKKIPGSLIVIILGTVANIFISKYTSFHWLKKIEFACKKDALAAYSKLNKGFDYVELPEITEEGIEEKVKKVGRGRPKKATSQDDATQQVSKYYMVTADVEIIIHEDVILEDKADGGVFAIMTNDVNKDWDMADLLGKYQSQQSVERGFRFLKDPEFFADSFFLKHPERVDALLMIMAVTLAIYSGIEYMIRAKLKATNQTLPNQLGKEIQNPTFRWLLMPLEQLYIRRMPDGRERLFCYDETFGGICVRLLKLLGTGYMNRYR